MDTGFFLILVIATGAIALGSFLYAYRRSRDTFHPMIYLGLMLFFLYSYMPLELLINDGEALKTYLSVPQLDYIQTLNLLGVSSLCLGVLVGSRNHRWNPFQHLAWNFSPRTQKRLARAAIVLGILGLLGFAAGIVNTGGLVAAYGRAYGGGYSRSGYVREAILLTLPALLWFMASHLQRPLSKLDWGVVVIFAAPLLMHGLLGARRGPTAMVVVALLVGWYLIRGKRPGLSRMLVGSCILGFLMLFLVSNRGNIYLGSDIFSSQSQRASIQYIGAYSGNEFIYGGGTILNADALNRYFWGRRYFTVFFIRPIPRALWPNKYEDASRILGIPNLEKNLGTGGEQLLETLGWQGAVGAAPGIIADMWLEFWWYFLLVLFGLGWMYGVAWRKAVTVGGLWIPVYTLMMALSVYLIMQTLEAMAFRFLFMSGASWLVWRYGIAGDRPSLPAPAVSPTRRLQPRP
ncbi:MAG: hypothetical protein WBA43_08160 [Elainellaceae cyanobacterium]